MKTSALMAREKPPGPDFRRTARLSWETRERRIEWTPRTLKLLAVLAGTILLWVLS